MIFNGITFVQTREFYKIKVKVAVSSATVWSKDYEGIVGVSVNSVWSIAKVTDQLAGGALAGAVKAMLRTPLSWRNWGEGEAEGGHLGGNGSPRSTQESTQTEVT